MSLQNIECKSSSRSYQPKFFFSVKEIDFAKGHLDYDQFLLQEFFTADLETRKQLSKFYLEEYGSRAFAYLKRKYVEWGKGQYHLTDLMKERILKMMPKFLNDNAKHKLGIHEFMSSIKNTVKSFQANQKSSYRYTTTIRQPQELISIFESEYEKIQKLTVSNFRFNVLTEEEKIEAIEISKYILLIKLQKTSDQIESDFSTFLPFMSKFNRGTFSAFYLISAFNIKINLNNYELNDIQSPRFKINETERNSRFKAYSDKYLAYELVSILKEANKAANNSLINRNDLNLFIIQYNNLYKGESEVSLNSSFQGEGGVLSLNVRIKPLRLFKTSIIISALKLTVYIILISAIILFALRNEHFTIFVLGSILGGIYVLNLIGDEIKQIKILKKEYKTYGKK